MLNISVLILTYNEELHLQRCLENIKLFSDNIYIVDCFSTDRTLSIAKSYNAEIIQHQWPGNHAEQLNWALENIDFRYEWILRIDADEYLTSELINELNIRLNSIPSVVNGIIFKRRHVFMGRWIKRGTYPARIMRMIRKGKAESENKLMDEHFRLKEGISLEFDYDFVDHNLNSLGWWIVKHNDYALRQAIDMLKSENVNKSNNLILNKKDKYATLPLFFRAFIYFIYRYIFKGGFLEGKEGFLWHFFQGWWYRTLVDARIYEIKKSCNNDPEKIISFLKEKHNIDISH